MQQDLEEYKLRLEQDNTRKIELFKILAAKGKDKDEIIQLYKEVFSEHRVSSDNSSAR